MADARELTIGFAAAGDLLPAVDGWRAQLEDQNEAWIVVGPEGGLSDEEEALLRSLGYADAHLAVGILRVETAAIVARALILDALHRG